MYALFFVVVLAVELLTAEYGVPVLYRRVHHG